MINQLIQKAGYCFLSIFIVLSGSNSAFAQAANIAMTRYSVYFETDQHALSAEAVGTLQTVAAATRQWTAVSIEIAAFTDAVGAADHNQRLSERRAKSVSDFLRQKGIASKCLSAQGRGEIADETDGDATADVEASATIDIAHSKNRRVDILVRHTVLPTDAANTPLAKIFTALGRDGEQQFTKKSTEDITLQGKNGTTINIEQGALQFADGSSPQGEIHFTLREAYDYSSMLANALSTASDDKLLETGGMVYVAAEADGKTLELQKGKTMSIAMPIINTDNANMQLFYGEQTAKTVNWKPAKQRIRQRSKYAQRVKWGRLPQPQTPSTDFALLVAPKYPPPPRVPQPPRESKNPAYNKRSIFEKLVESDKKLGLAWQHREEQKQADYQKNKLKYTRDSLNYVTNAAPTYRREMAEYKAELEKRAVLYRYYVDAYARYEANKFLFAQMRWIEPFTSRNAGTYLDWYTTGFANFLNLKGAFVNATKTDFERENKDIIARAFGIPRANLDTMQLYNPDENTDLAALIDKNVDSRLLIADDWAARRAQQYQYLMALNGRGLAKAKGLDTLFTKISTYIVQTRISNASGNALMLNTKDDAINTALQNGMEASRLGWINCDRFLDEQLAKTSISVDEDAPPSDVKLFIVFKDIKSIMTMHQFLNQYQSSQIPIGRKVTIVALKTENEQFFLSQQVAIIQPKMLIQLDYKKVGATQIKAAFASLN